MNVVVVDDAEAVGAQVAALVSRSVERDPALVLGVATGATPLPVYRALARGSADFSAVRVVALDEYVGLPAGHPASFAAYVDHEIAEPLGINTRTTSWCRGGAVEELERRIKELGGVDLQLLGIGRNGHLAFNEPGRRWTPAAGWWRSATRPGGTTRRYLRREPVPTHAVTQGLGTILEARHLVLLATGAAKAEAVAAALTGPVTPGCPASVVQLHPRVTVVLDGAAASVSSGGGASTARSASASTIHSCRARTCCGVEAGDVAQPHPGLDAADAAQRDRQPMHDVVAEPLAKGFECLLEPRDHPPLAEWKVMRCVAEREPEHGPLEVLGLRDAVDHAGSDRSDSIEGLRGRRVREHRRAGGLRERRGQQLRLRREVAVGGGAGDAGCFGGLLDPWGVSALHQLPRGGHQLVASALLLLGAPRLHVVP